MDYVVLDNPPYATFWRLVTIDGGDGGEMQQPGRVVCINGTGDLPLSSYIIDPTKCVAEIPIIPPQNPPIIPSISEPSQIFLLVTGIFLLFLYRKIV